MIKKLFVLGVIAIPFSDFYGLLPLGEMQYEMSAYFFLLVMTLMVAANLKTRKLTLHSERQSNPTDLLILKIMGLMLGVIIISFLMNFQDMMGGSFRGRYPIAKFLTSTMVVVYGFALAYAAYGLGKKYSWYELVIWPTAISVVLCALFAALEMLAWISPAAYSLYSVVAYIPHSGFEIALGKNPADILFIGRARSLTFEPPALANFASFAWPWIYAGLHSTNQNRRIVYFVLLLLCSGLIIAAWSRTSAVLLGGNILVFILLRCVYLSTRPRSSVIHVAVSFLLLVFTLSILLGIFFDADSIVANVVGGDSISNITRLASITSAINMFLDHPIFGYGFGQYGFHFMQYVPSWGYYSWEVTEWIMQDPLAVIWPPVYSIYARFAAELGIVGVVVWVGIWLWLARTVWRLTLAYQRATGNILLMSYPLIMSCYCALFSGISLDSLRTPMLWIDLGLACCYIRHVRSRLPELQKRNAVTL